MILDNFDSMLCDYGNMDVRLNRAFDWLRRTNLQALPDGIVTVEGKVIYAIVATYMTEPKEERSWEAHRSYIDIQVPVRGKELQLWTPLANLKTATVPYVPEKDVVKFGEPANGVVEYIVKPGDFAVFFPTDGHKPGCAAGGVPEEVKKITVKIAV